LADNFRAATLGGVRVLPAGQLRPGGWLLVREAAALAPPLPAAAGARWDGRFCLYWAASPPVGTEIGALAADAARLRRASDLPTSALQTLPAVRLRGKLVAVPHLGYAEAGGTALPRAAFMPAVVAAGAPFLPATA
jgi:tRNA(Ile)-lysidine synthase